MGWHTPGPNNKEADSTQSSRRLSSRHRHDAAELAPIVYLSLVAIARVRHDFVQQLSFSSGTAQDVLLLLEARRNQDLAKACMIREFGY